MLLADIIMSFEARLKEMNPRSRQLTYNLPELLDYIDSLSDISALVFDDRSRAYIPHDRVWIKQKVANMLERSRN
jgi:hypothetical protein